MLYILCGLGHLVRNLACRRAGGCSRFNTFVAHHWSLLRPTQLAAFSVEDLIPFYLPTGASFPSGVSGPVLAVNTHDR